MIGIQEEVGFYILDILKALMAGIFTPGSDGDRWKSMKSLMMPLF